MRRSRPRARAPAPGGGSSAGSSRRRSASGRTSAPVAVAERGDVGCTVPELDRNPEVRIAAGEAVGAVERGGQRDRPDRVRIGRRLDPHDPQPNQGSDRDGLRERLEDVPAEPRLERSRELARAVGGTPTGRTRGRSAPARPTAFHPSPWRRESRNSACASRGEVGALPQTKVEPVDERLARLQAPAPRHESRICRTSRRSGSPACAGFWFRGSQRKTRQIARSPAGEHADRDHAARPDAEPLRRARVEQHFARPARGRASCPASSFGRCSATPSRPSRFTRNWTACGPSRPTGRFSASRAQYERRR